MSPKDKPEPTRALTPREELRRYMSPARFKATRRQVLKAFGLGAAAIGCSDGESGDPAETPSSSAPTAEPAAEPSNPTANMQPPMPPGGVQAGEQEANPQGPLTQSPQEPAMGMDAQQDTDAPPETELEPDPQPEMDQDPEVVAELDEDLEPSDVEIVDPEDVPGADEPMGRSAFDVVELGSTGITTSRLAMGSGTTGYDGSSVQTRMGAAFTDLLVQGFDRGIRFFETADAYGSHTVTGNAMQKVGRQNVTLLTKTMANTRAEAEADLDRFMEELQTDYLDIVLLHIRSRPTWVSDAEGAMEVLAEAKQAGRIRAHGVSCHSLEALRIAARTDWVDLNLCRINPFQLHMDSDPQTIIGILDEMKSAGKATVGMKILAQGDASDRFDEAIEHATRLDCIDAFTIGFRSAEEFDQVVSKIASVTFA